MAKYSGKRGAIYLSITLAGNAASLGGQTSYTLDMAADQLDVSSFGDTNKVSVLGLRGLSGTFEGNWDDSVTQIFAGAVSTTGVYLILYPSLDAPTKYAAGGAWMDASLSTGVNEKVSTSAKFVAASSWFVNL
jgi:hypothetical protein